MRFFTSNMLTKVLFTTGGDRRNARLLLCPQSQIRTRKKRRKQGTNKTNIVLYTTENKDKKEWSSVETTGIILTIL